MLFVLLHKHQAQTPVLVTDDDHRQEPEAIEFVQFTKYAWRASPWGTCTKHCGGGVRERGIECIDSTDDQPVQVPSEMCLEKHKPDSQEECNNRACTPHKLVAMTLQDKSKGSTCGNMHECGISDSEALVCRSNEG